MDTDYTPELDDIVLADPTSVAALEALRAKIGNDALPGFLIDYIKAVMTGGGGTLAIHTASSIATAASVNQAAISRAKSLMGKSQLEPNKFPSAVHHVKIFYNAKGRAKLFYKHKGSLQFIQNLGAQLAA